MSEETTFSQDSVASGRPPAIDPPSALVFDRAAGSTCDAAPHSESAGSLRANRTTDRVGVDGDTPALRVEADKAAPVRYDITIKERPSDERPRERLEHLGAGSLSVTELLAIQLRTGSAVQSALGLAGELLHAFGGLRGIAGASREELCRVKGIGPVKAVEICAAVELSRRLSVLSVDEKPCIRSPQDVSNLLMAEMRDLKKEHLRSLLLDRSNAQM
jgi:hypothetical protein